MANTFNLSIDQGADYEVTFTYADSSQSPIDVTGYSALMQLRVSPGDDVILSLTDLAGITVGTTDGTFSVFIPAVQTTALTQDCRYDLLITDTTGHRTRLVEGAASVDLAISVPS